MTEINFDDYLSFEEKKQIVSDVFRNKVAIEFNKERVFGNAAYDIIRMVVDEHFNGEMSEIITAKAIEIVKSLSSYTVFHKKDAWERENSKAYDHLQAVLNDCKPLIQDRVSAIISELDENEIRENLKDYAMEILDRKLFGEKQ